MITRIVCRAAHSIIPAQRVDAVGGVGAIQTFINGGHKPGDRVGAADKSVIIFDAADIKPAHQQFGGAQGRAIGKFESADGRAVEHVAQVEILGTDFLVDTSNIFVIIYIVNYSIHYYSERVQKEILCLPVSLQARYIGLTNRMGVRGANLGEPHTKAMGNGLFELRLIGIEGIARVFYCTLSGKRIVMLHGFVKKTQKMPISELDIAIRRMKEVKNADAR